jgi:ferredoxin
MYEILDDVSRGCASLEHLHLLEELAQVVKDTSMCGLGQTAPNPVLSTLRYFRSEYLEHIQRRRCPAGVCKELITYSIGEQCHGCQVCVKACPTGAIQGQKKARHSIDTAKCIKCGACRGVCEWDAVEVN